MNHCTCQNREGIEGALYCGYCGKAALLPPWRDATGKAVDGVGLLPAPFESPSEVVLILAKDLPAGAYFSTSRLRIGIDSVKADERLRLQSASLINQAGVGLALKFKWIDFNSSDAGALTPEELQRLLPKHLFNPFNAEKARLCAELIRSPRPEGVLTIALPGGLPLREHSFTLKLVYNLRAAVSGGTLAAHKIDFEQTLLLQPPVLEIASNDPRFESTTHLFLAIEGQHQPIEASVSVRSGAMELCAAQRLFFTPMLAMPIPVESRVEGGRLCFSLRRDHWSQIGTVTGSPAGAPSGVLSVCDGERILAAVPMEIRRVSLGLKLFSEVMNFKFDEQRNWIADGPAIEEPVAADFQGEWRENFVVDCVPGSGLEKCATASCKRINKTLEIKPALKPEWVYGLGDARQAGGFQKGTLTFFLRNKNNLSGPPDVRKQANTVPLFTIDVSVATLGREPMALLNIDFGTTNTSAAFARNSDLPPETISIDGSKDIPTQIYYALKDDAVDYATTQIGEFARTKQMATPDPARFQSGIKTLLLTSVKKDTLDVPDLVQLSKTVFRTPKELVRDFLRVYLRQIACGEQIDGRRIEKITFTFPVTAPHEYRGAVQAALKEALAESGLAAMAGAIASACDEATAGGLWWFNQYMESPDAALPLTLMVYDYGGGTTDISLIRFETKPGDDAVVQVRILGVAGMPFCGGEDVTWKLVREFAASSERTKQPWIQFVEADFQNVWRENRIGWYGGSSIHG